MTSLLDHQRKLLEECGLSTDGMSPARIAERARAVLGAADRYRLRAEAAQRLRDPHSVPANRLMARWGEGRD